MTIVGQLNPTDFRNRLVRIGVPVPEGAAPDVAAQLLLQTHAERPIPEFEHTMTDLMTQFDTMGPAVREAMEQHVLPTLR